MPSFCPKCGDHVELEVCGKCGEAAVTTKISSWKDPIKTAGANVDGTNAGYIPSAFVAAARLQQTMGLPYVAPPPRREKATALYDFVPQDPTAQLKLRKGDSMEVIRKDSDGWWLVRKDGEKGLVPGSYLQVEAPVSATLDPAILAAREASNQRFMQWRRSSESDSTPGADANGTSSTNGVSHGGSNGATTSGPGHVDARAADAVEDKPKVVRKLKKCLACKETILGRTKTAKNEIFHEICLICRGCRETIEEDDEFTIVKKKAYHADCADEIIHCRSCDKEILGRVYKTGGGSFHKLCLVCSQCQKQFDENGGMIENDQLVCSPCVNERKRKEEEAKAAAAAREAEERAAKQRAAEEKAAAELAAAQRAAEMEAAKAAAAKAKAEEEEAAKAALAAEAEAAAKAKPVEDPVHGNVDATGGNQSVGSNTDLESEASLHEQRNSEQPTTRSTINDLDQFDLGSAELPVDHGTQERLSQETDLDFENDYGGSFYSLNGERDSLRLSQVIDFGAVQEFNANSHSGRTTDRLSMMSDLSNISETDDFDTGNIGGPSSSLRATLPPAMEEGAIAEEDEDDGEREMCGGCGVVLEGEAVGALNQYFHYECFKCSHCRRVIAENDGYAEKDNMAFHQACYQARFSKRCCRCDQNLKGKVVKALDSLYHPDCFVCYQCKSSLSESFFEHDGQAVCARCKHIAITANPVRVSEGVRALSVGTVGYHFAAQDETQLTIEPGQQVSILQKDDDGWWFVDLHGKQGYVPGSYLIEHPKESARASTASSRSSHASSTAPASNLPASATASPGTCSECGTQNPDIARFCRKCGNQLQ